MALFQSKAARAGKEICLAVASYYTAHKVVSYAVGEALPTNPAIAANLDNFAGALGISLFAGETRMTQRPGTRLFPSISRPPLPMHATAIAATLAFVLSPLVTIPLKLSCQPLIQWYHTSAERERQEKLKPEHTVASQLATKQQETTTPSIPVPTDGTLQLSVGTAITPYLEYLFLGSATLIGPLWEEIAFRGLLFGRLVPIIGFLPAALGSSAAFGAIHQGVSESNYLPVFETILGFTCSLLYFRTGRLLVPIAFHAGNNVLAVLVAALESCGEKAYCGYLYEKEMITEPPILSFWDRFVAKNFTSIVGCIPRVWGSYNAFFPSEYTPFVPLNFWGTEEKASPSSAFFDNEKNQLMKAPDLRNADGSTTMFAELLIEKKVELLFRDEDSIPVEQLFSFLKWEQSFRLVLHILATMPQNDESGILQMALDRPIAEIIAMDAPAMLDADKLACFFKKGCAELGYCVLMSDSSGTVARSEYKEDCMSCLRYDVGLDDLNQELFIIYCIDRAKTDSKILIRELVKEYSALGERLNEL